MVGDRTKLAIVTKRAASSLAVALFFLMITLGSGGCTGSETGTPGAGIPVRLVVDIEKMETSGFSTVWLRPLNSQGSILVIEGTVAAKLTLVEPDGTLVPAFTWNNISVDESNYSTAKGAEVSFPYPIQEQHDYDETGNLQVTLTLKNGYALTAMLKGVSLHPSEIV
jgi:hypothetical protein